MCQKQTPKLEKNFTKMFDVLFANEERIRWIEENMVIKEEVAQVSSVLNYIIKIVQEIKNSKRVMATTVNRRVIVKK
ncbi:hypothetical protein ACFL2U_03670 [Patescibacteria group bacterium]